MQFRLTVFRAENNEAPARKSTVMLNQLPLLINWNFQLLPTFSHPYKTLFLTLTGHVLNIFTFPLLIYALNIVQTALKLLRVKISRTPKQNKNG